MDTGWNWYFTAPWEPVAFRRGDALGFRASADYFAELLAPGLSNATADARWITLLSWCLKWSHVAWQKSGGNDLSQLDAQRARYMWLRPLELLWVDRTLEAGQETGQLRGRRSIERWRKAKRLQPNFAMSPEQFQRFRQVGTYGAYRVVFRKNPGLTFGDGWTPEETTLKLAKLVDKSLPPEARLDYQSFDGGTKWGHWIGNEARYWVEKGWIGAVKKPRQGLRPTSNEDLGKQLPENERALLEPVLFGHGTVRRATAKALSSAKSASSHADLCHVLANSREIAKKIDLGLLAPLPAFSCFADAAMDAMRNIWNTTGRSEAQAAVPVEEVVRSSEARASLERAREAGCVWLDAQHRKTFPNERVITALADILQKKSSPVEQLRALAFHRKRCEYPTVMTGFPSTFFARALRERLEQSHATNSATFVGAGRGEHQPG